MARNEAVVATSSALFEYASELAVYIRETEETLVLLANKHRILGQSWNDDLYNQFSEIIQQINITMADRLEELLRLQAEVVERAQLLLDIERTKF